MKKIKSIKLNIFSIFLGILTYIYAGEVFTIPEKFIKNEIIKYEAPIISQNDFSKYKNLLPSLPEGSRAVSINDKSGYTALMYQKRVTLLDSYYSSFLKNIGGEISTQYRNKKVTHHYEIYMLAKNINSFEDCMNESKLKASRLLDNFGWNWNSKQEFILVGKDTLAFKTEGFFLRKSINIGFKCSNKNLWFMVALREPV